MWMHPESHRSALRWLFPLCFTNPGVDETLDILSYTCKDIAMNKHRKRAQAPKRINRHDSALGDKRRSNTGAVQRGERFDRNDFRSQAQRRQW